MPIDRSKPVIVQVRDLLESLVGASKSVGAIALSDNPADGDTLTLFQDHTYTFVETASTDLYAVTIGSTHWITAQNLESAILNTIGGLNSAKPNLVTLEELEEPDDDGSSAEEEACTIYLSSVHPGKAGNQEILVDVTGEAIQVTGMIGGSSGILMAADSVAVNINNTSAQLTDAQAGEVWYVRGLNLVLGSGITSLKFTDDQGDTILDLGAWADGGDLNIPPQMSRDLTVCAAIGDINLVVAGGCVKGLVFLGYE